MGLQNPNAGVDAYRIQCPAEAAFASASATVCCFLKGSPAVYVIFDNMKSSPAGSRAGKRLWMTGSNVRWSHAVSTGSITHQHAHGGFSGWHFFWGRTDAAGTTVTAGMDGAQTSASVAAAVSESNGEAPTLLNQVDGSRAGNFILGGLWSWSHGLSDDEIQAIRFSGGRVLPRNGMECEMRMFDDAPGVDTDTTVPMDGALPSRAWAAVGVGTAYNHVESDYPLRARPR